MAIRRLTRSRSEGKIAGICAGIANYFEVDVTLVRAAWLVFSIVPGCVIGGVLAYLLAWLVIPEDDGELSSSAGGRRLTRSATDRKIAGVCGGLAEYFGVDATPIRLLWIILSILIGAVIGGVVAYLVAWLIIPRPQTIDDDAQPGKPDPLSAVTELQLERIRHRQPCRAATKSCPASAKRATR